MKINDIRRKCKKYVKTGKLYLYEFSNNRFNGPTIVEKVMCDDREFAEVLYSAGRYKNMIGEIYLFNDWYVVKEDINLGDYAHLFI